MVQPIESFLIISAGAMANFNCVYHVLVDFGAEVLTMMPTCFVFEYFKLLIDFGHRKI